MRTTPLAVLAALLAAPAMGAETAAFLRVQPGARPMGMGEAFTAVADDLNSMTTNPAGLASLAGRQAGFTHAELLAGAHYDFAAAALSGWGLSVQRLSQGGIDGRDASGQATGSFGAADTAVSLAGASRANGYLFGAALKYVDSRIADASARTVAADAGVMRPFAVGGVPMTVGAALRNVGPGLRYGDVTEPLPLTASFGASARLAGAFLVSADVSRRPNARETDFSIGSEYAVIGGLALRLGYLSGASFGAGFGLKLGAATVDYSFSPSPGDLGSAQRISLTSRF